MQLLVAFFAHRLKAMQLLLVSFVHWLIGCHVTFWCFFHKAWVTKLNPIAPHGSQIINGLDWSELLDTQGA
jgi:hypothetical protein